MSQQAALYDIDFYVWTQAQAAALRDGKLDAMDLVNLAEEIESLGKSDRRALGSHLQVLLLHLLKWQYQPSMRQTGFSWRTTIRNARHSLSDIADDSPSLRRQIPALLPTMYQRARDGASDETGLPLATFPEQCPWEGDQVIAAEFFPEG